jgi:2-polyprenyl-6-methoxyphenol hydroxylase-like FAD-dependent oxidoreductase
MVLRTGASAGMIPTNDGQTCLFVGPTAQRMRAARATGTGNAFNSILQTVSRDAWRRVSGTWPPTHLRGYAGQSGYLRQAGGPGWALVGDAGAFEDPLSTHGITDAFRDAELLAAAVRDIRGGAASEAAALAGYQVQRDRLADSLFSVVESIASYRWTTAALRRMLLEASSAMTEQVEALHRLDESDSGDRLSA